MSALLELFGFLESGGVGVVVTGGRSVVVVGAGKTGTGVRSTVVASETGPRGRRVSTVVSSQSGTGGRTVSSGQTGSVVTSQTGTSAVRPGEVVIGRTSSETVSVGVGPSGETSTVGVGASQAGGAMRVRSSQTGSVSVGPGQPMFVSVSVGSSQTGSVGVGPGQPVFMSVSVGSSQAGSVGPMGSMDPVGTSQTRSLRLVKVMRLPSVRVDDGGRRARVMSGQTSGGTRTHGVGTVSPVRAVGRVMGLVVTAGEDVGSSGSELGRMSFTVLVISRGVGTSVGGSVVARQTRVSVGGVVVTGEAGTGVGRVVSGQTRRSVSGVVAGKPRARARVSDIAVVPGTESRLEHRVVHGDTTGTSVFGVGDHGGTVRNSGRGGVRSVSGSETRTSGVVAGPSGVSMTGVGMFTGSYSICSANTTTTTITTTTDEPSETRRCSSFARLATHQAREIPRRGLRYQERDARSHLHRSCRGHRLRRSCCIRYRIRVRFRRREYLPW